MKLTLSSRLFQHVPFDECLSIAVAAGFRALSVDGAHLPWSAPTSRAEELKRMGDAAGIELGLYDPGVGRFLESGGPEIEFPKAVKAAKLTTVLGCRRLVVHPSARPGKPSELFEQVKRESLLVRRLMDDFASELLNPCLSIRPQSLAHDSFCAVGMLQRIDRIDAKVIFEPASLYLARMDASEKSLGYVADRVGGMLLRNIQFLEDGSVAEARLANGVVQYFPLLRRLASARFDGYLVIGSHYRPRPDEDLRRIAEEERIAAEEAVKDALQQSR